MTERMRGSSFRQLSVPYGLPHGLLDNGLVEVVSVSNARSAVRVERGCAKYVLPPPLAVRIQVLFGQGEGERSAAEASSEVPLVDVTDGREVVKKVVATRGGEHGHSVLCPFAVTDTDLVPLEIDVLDPQGEAFHEAHPRPVQQTADKARHAPHSIQHRLDLASREHNRQPPWCFGALELLDGAHLLVEYPTVEKD
jgi:hypothetical protein